VAGYLLNEALTDFSAYRRKRSKMKKLTLEIMEKFNNNYEEVMANKVG
jgi:hypothetical protein